MARKDKVIFWDFDGTLVHFLSWRLAILDVLNECETGHHVTPEQFGPFLQEGYPWHDHDKPHTHIKTPDAWWQALEPVFVRCYRGVGYSPERAAVLATQVRKYITKSERYILYEDTLTVLAELKEKGWRHFILSNHVPELPQIVNALGLMSYVDNCITSGVTGYEKPHPQAFRIAMEAAGNPQNAWLVGDNIGSDIKGAENMGIPAILVHKPPMESTRYYAATLEEVVGIIINSPLPVISS